MKAQEILSKRRDRMIAIVLHVKDRDVDPLLTQMPGGTRAAALLRKVILDQINDFYDMALDVSSSCGADDYEFNPEIWSRRIEGHLRDLSLQMQRLADANGHRA